MFECKIKHDSYITKDSVRLSRTEYDGIINGDYSFILSRNEPVLLEFYKQSKIAGLRPVVIVDYLRQVFICGEGNVRVTFDKYIQASSFELDLFCKSPIYYSVTGNDEIVLELKYDNYIPMYIKSIFSGVDLLNMPVSKYVLCAAKIMEVRHHA